MLVREPGEVSKFDEFGGSGLDIGEVVQRLVERKQIVFGGGNCRIDVAQIDPLAVSPALERLLAVGVIDEKTPHGFGRSGKKVAARIPVPGLFDVDEFDEYFVDEPRRLQRLTGLFLRHLRRGEFAQFSGNNSSAAFSSPSSIDCRMRVTSDMLTIVTRRDSDRSHSVAREKPTL